MKNKATPKAMHFDGQGFTLIELVVVIAIIATLTGLAAFNFGQARSRARDVQRKSELRQIQNALELYKNDQFPQSYPDNAIGLSAALVSAYMERLPVDPKEKVEDGTWFDYGYNRTSQLTYALQTCLENTSDPDKLTPVVTCGAGNAGYIYQLTQP
ncbi:hypothetical protein A3A84_02320 [Candidatus Collierbacteria bacterium RIFCSPLOWO2_01_FULL_50_23]|uniref:Type II secretion system protein GspG C-terminal domain-containing protein n=2 Tax=Candidatus Collieribacteriota TaxID=1752725 RepID=A0A1F5EWC1_9BACT|nr:MAG: hypothetical protein A2703_02315 [Candidatus Collierbacteria bacterium RIFCSPHIGHO2_01_FULL_50_25]OGD71650.1 MAG: hypothetical protein A3D09_02155 [Candidatus Collierbacteria bacterium RIFCSPHIGHO2_02_FULL_49_10]OGD73794.1 MAG: hypothetical protein A3A84_02320 [Candidatus Collierbacteria bacterium RIFCSPLOWO2_01_FULL_50_23]